MMPASLHLLEPYRSAVTSMATDEQLATIYPPEADISKVPSIVIGRDPELRATTLQMLVLFEEATLIHHEIANPEEVFDRHRFPSMSLKPMELDGILRFGVRATRRTTRVPVSLGRQAGLTRNTPSTGTATQHGSRLSSRR